MIYRETRPDKSFRLDILHYSKYFCSYICLPTNGFLRICLITDNYVSFKAPELNALWKTEGDIPEIETPEVEDSELERVQVLNHKRVVLRKTDFPYYLILY